MNWIIKCATLLFTLCATTSCESINDERIPPVAVYIDLSNQATWDTYGVHGYGQHRQFIKQERIPANYPFSALSYTGFGGVLLISGRSGDDYNSPLAYDLACPVEAKNNVRLSIDQQTFEAYCPKCHSRFDVCENNGAPISGEALSRNYGLQRYKVNPAQMGGYIITR
jgi:hypothetical protein